MFRTGPSPTVRVVFAVLVALVLMVTDQRYRHLEALRSMLTVAVYPLFFLARLPSDSARWANDRIRTMEDLVDQNNKIQVENFELKGRMAQYDALQAENIRLRDLLESSFRIPDRVLVAELMAVDLDPYRHHVMINKGSSSGVYVGQPVLDADAVIGQVVRVSPLTATVLMITDPRHALPVQVNRNGLRCIAEGTGRTDRLNLLYLPINADIQTGDLLVTSGLGGHFPTGYPVAKVEAVRRESGQAFASVSAVPNVQVEQVRQVLLVWTLLPQVANTPPWSSEPAAHEETPEESAAASKRPSGGSGSKPSRKERHPGKPSARKREATTP